MKTIGRITDFLGYCFTESTAYFSKYHSILLNTLAGGLCEDHRSKNRFLANSIAKSTVYFFIIIIDFIFAPFIDIIEYDKLKLNCLHRDHPPAKPISSPLV